MNKQQQDQVLSDLLAWYEAAGRHDLPWRVDPTPYRVLVSEMMLQQTQVSRVLGFFERWMERFPDLSTLAQADLDDVIRCWQGLGYYRRARALKSLADQLAESDALELPDSVSELRALPGIGPYTAAAICAFAHDQPEPALDTNLIRVLTRLLHGNPEHESASAERGHHALLARSLTAWLEQRSPHQITSALMDFGALVCTARTPLCKQCPLSKHCAAYASGGPVIAASKHRGKPSVAKPTLAVGVLREGSRARLPKRSGLLIAKLESKQSARAALQAAAKRRYGIEIAVRPAYAEGEYQGEPTSFHRCSLLIGDAERFPLATLKRIARLSEEERAVLAALKLMPKS